MDKKKKNWMGKAAVTAAAIAAILAYYFIPSVNQTMNTILSAFASGDFTVVRAFVESYGAYAAAVSFLLMILQSIAAPLPAFLLTFANANLFGWWKGAILSWSSAMAGAAVCFFIARMQEFWEEMLPKSLQVKQGLSRLMNSLRDTGR